MLIDLLVILSCINLVQYSNGEEYMYLSSMLIFMVVLSV